ncbi:hypothetical protein AZ54_10820 [Xanthomonas oryzae pv. oryzae PXO86]|nr:hypothetical protein AZ54_10820 [Xanthomonas oryzae pv. oryzae PXO86]
MLNDTRHRIARLQPRRAAAAGGPYRRAATAALVLVKARMLRWTQNRHA